MKNVTRRLKKALTEKKGETLMESLVSLLIFVIMFAGIAAMIQFSFRVTGVGTTQINANQVLINDAALVGNHPLEDTLNLTGGGINVDIDVTLFNDNGFVAFAPEVP